MPNQPVNLLFNFAADDGGVDALTQSIDALAESLELGGVITRGIDQSLQRDPVEKRQLQVDLVAAIVQLLLQLFLLLFVHFMLQCRPETLHL